MSLFFERLSALWASLRFHVCTAGQPRVSSRLRSASRSSRTFECLEPRTLMAADSTLRPEVAVYYGSQLVSDGDLTPAATDGTNFGAVAQGQKLSRTFTVRNLGTAPLTISGLRAPGDFKVTEGLAARLAPGASDTFTVQIDSAKLGQKSGQITFVNNDANERVFNFAISGNVKSAAAATTTSAAPPATTTTAPATTTSTVPTTDVFALHSRPGATKKIYLDLNGNTTVQPSWNGGAAVVTPRFDSDGNPASFSSTELAQIKEIWQRVSEYFAPFDVDVTTEDPGAAGLTNSGGTDTQWGIRVVIGGNGDWYSPTAVGVAGLNSFGTNRDCFVFSDDWNDSPIGIASTVAHEVGHTLGLVHDGRNTPAEDYYAGHGTGATRWQPIMGSGPVTGLEHWNKGEYAAADNTQDDLATLTRSQNGFSFRADDHAGTFSGASALGYSSQTSLKAAGVIEKPTDADYFKFAVRTAGTVVIDVSPATYNRMLDAEVRLYDASFKLIATANPADQTLATLSRTLPVGTYYLRVDGVGKGDPRTTGYSDYGSLGSFAVSVTGSAGATFTQLASTSSSALAAPTSSGTTSSPSTATSSPTVADSLPPAASKITPTDDAVWADHGLPSLVRNNLLAELSAADSDACLDIALALWDRTSSRW